MDNNMLIILIIAGIAIYFVIENSKVPLYDSDEENDSDDDSDDEEEKKKSSTSNTSTSNTSTSNTSTSNTSTSITSYITDGILSIVWNKHPNKCFDADNPTEGESKNSHLWDCANDNENQFFIYDKDTNQLRLNKNKDICITRQGDKEKIQMDKCAKKSSKDVYEKQIFGYNEYNQVYSLKEPTQCLDVFEGKTDNGASIVSWNCDKGSDYQKFNLKKKV